MRRMTVFLAAMMPLLLAGCGGNQDDLRQWVQQTLARPPGQIEPIPEIRTPVPVIYEAHALRDPFLRAMPQDNDQTDVASGPRPDPERRREYLERFPLDALDMVGTIAIGGDSFGLVEDVDGTIHRVSEGNYLGQNHGRIVRVTPVAIELVELVPNGAEGWMEREARIALDENSEQG